MKVLFIKEKQIIVYDGNEVTIADAQNLYDQGYIMHVLREKDLVTYQIASQ